MHATRLDGTHHVPLKILHAQVALAVRVLCVIQAYEVGVAKPEEAIGSIIKEYMTIKPGLCTGIH
jgi:hypothetical protein